MFRYDPYKDQGSDSSSLVADNFGSGLLRRGPPGGGEDGASGSGADGGGA